MAPKILPSRELLRQLLAYDPVTGIFTWLSRPRDIFITEHHQRTWNTSWAGKPAGCVVDARRWGFKWRQIKIGDVKFKAHRLAWLYVHGEPVPAEIDHIDGDQLNNRIANLRAASHSENMANRGAQRNNSTGAKGVSRHRKKYYAKIKLNGVMIHLGSFDTAEDAAEAYREAAIRLFGEFARW